MAENRPTTVVNILGGAGIGKSPCALTIVAELKKQGYQAEYVQEVAKELVYAGDMEHLDGSLSSQAHILAQQKQRLDLLIGQVDYIVTDSPLPLNIIYLKEQQPEYEQEVLREFGSYQNTNIVLGRDLAVEYQTEGRIHTLEESLVKDKEIVELLEKNSLPYKSFERSDISGIIEYITSEEQQRDNSSKLTLSSEEIEDIAKKIQQNANETNHFKEQLNSFFDTESRATNRIVFGKTPFSLSLGGADTEKDLIIKPRNLIKISAPYETRYHAHNISRDVLDNITDEIRCPIMLLKGTMNDTLVAVTSIKDDLDRIIIVSFKLGRTEQEINEITSIYGRNNFISYLERQIESNNVIALNKEKANEMFQSLGLQSPPNETLISFDNSIAYSLKNVKYPEPKTPKNIGSIVIDTETTGLNAFEDELLQVSIIDTQETVLYNEYVRPTRHERWDRAMVVNNITPEMVAGAKTIEEQLPAINAITSKATEIIGYNTPFDVNFLSASGVEFADDVKETDVMADFSQRHGVWDEAKGKYKWIKLVECAEHYGYDWSSAEGQAHNSVSDCYATLYCYNKLSEEIRQEQEQLEALQRQREAERNTLLTNDKVRIYVDMDGTLARFHDEVRYLERMWEEGFFEQLKPFQEMVDSIKLLKQRNPAAEIYILSAAIEGEPPYCKRQKHEWLDRYLPEIDKEHRIFTDIGVPKAEYINGGIKPTDILIDDYNKGLEEWQSFGGTSVKCHNNINHKGLVGKLWEGDIIHNFESPQKICEDIVKIANALTDNTGQGQALQRTPPLPEPQQHTRKKK